MVSDNLERSERAAALLIPFLSLTLLSFNTPLNPKVKTQKLYKQVDSETTREAGEGLAFSQSHVLVFIDFFIHHQHLFVFL